MPRKRRFTNIMDWPDEKKNLIYARIDRLYQDGSPVLVKEHRSKFPAVTIEVNAADAHIHIITDTVSAEQYSKRKTG